MVAHANDVISAAAPTAAIRFRFGFVGLGIGPDLQRSELGDAAGCKWDFSAATVNPLTDLVKEELASLN